MLKDDTLPACRSLLLLAALSLPALQAAAGPTEPGRHAFERIGPAGSAPALAVQLPGTNRALAFAADGAVSLVTGDGLLYQPIGQVPVDDGCAGPKVFAAAWDPAAPGERLFITYQRQIAGSLCIGRLDLAPNALGFSFERVFDTASGSACENVGGGLAFAADGTLLLGVGDHGNPASAGSQAARTGKILRVTVDGLPPMAPLTPNPLNPNSPLYAMGVRDPVSITTDPVTGESWFLDRGPAGGADELNLVQPLTNHGWTGTMLTGFLEVPGDPFHVWDPPAGVSGLRTARGLLADSLGGGLVVASAGTGAISVVTPNPLDTMGSTEQSLYTPDPDGPQAFADPRAYADGSLHLVADDGGLWRLRLRAAATTEPSRGISVVPSVLRKDGAGGFELSAERVALGATYGLHVGDLASLWQGYNHADDPDRALAAQAPTGAAQTRWPLTQADLGGAGNSVYYLLGAGDGCGATGLGIDSANAARPGGLGSAGGGSIPLLGNGSHDLADVIVTRILSGADGLAAPSDLEFHPDNAGQLWLVNHADDSTVIVDDTGRAGQTSRYVWTSSGNHFLAKPSALAFGPGTEYFATSHDEDDFTQGPPPAGTPADFMGPTLWTNSDLIYEGGHGSHYDMLHNTPNGAGIAWESGPIYWLFDGWNASLTRYDFNDDHGLGGSDHTDGEIDRYAEGELGYVPDVPSHLVWDADSSELIVADTGNNRILVFDPEGAVNDYDIGPNYDGCTLRGWSGGTLTTLIDGAAHGLVQPSGLELHDCKIWVSDHATSTIYAFSRNGELLDWLETELPPGSLAGMAFDPRDGDLYLVDMAADEILRISPR